MAELKKSKSGDLWKKISAIQVSADPVLKDSTLPYGGAKAISIKAVLDVYLPLCKEHGICVIPIKQELVGDIKTGMGRNGNEYSLFANCFFRVIDIEGGEYHDFSMIIQGVDASDKATGKMATYALKYAYKQLFSSRSTDDDPDVAQRQEEKSQPVKQQQKKQEQTEEDVDEKKAAFNAGKKAIQARYTLADAHETNRIPSWKTEYKPFVDGVIKPVKQEDVRKHLADFSLFWWHCLDLSGNLDIAKAEASYKKSKSKMSADNIKFIEDIIGRRKKAIEE